MKTITLTQSDYTNITKAFFFYLENEKELTTSGISPHVWINELSITGDE